MRLAGKNYPGLRLPGLARYAADNGEPPTADCNSAHAEATHKRLMLPCTAKMEVQAAICCVLILPS